MSTDRVRKCRTGDGYPVDGRSDLCAAHRKRAQRNDGDPLAHIPVRRKPSRRPYQVRVRQAAAAARELRAQETHDRQMGVLREVVGSRRRITAVTA